MIEKKISFYSEGYSLQGTLYLPEDLKEGEKRPAIIPNSGYNGFNQFYPRMFAKKLTQSGYICLGFDYRGFADSEGERGRVILSEQVQDINNAITFLQLQENVDHNRIGLIGWGMGASHVIEVTAKNKRVSAVAALNGFYNGERWLKSVHTYRDWRNILETLEEDRIRRVTKGDSLLADPFIHYPLDPATKSYVAKELSPLNGFGERTKLQFTESIIEMNVEKHVKEMAPVPLFIAHGVNNLLHPYEEAIFLYEAANEPKELYTIDGKHNDFMYSDHEEFLKLTEKLILFFNKSLRQTSAVPPSMS
ncbi:hypothetical protein SAMN04488112_12820 [Melghirimyces thermohalophilus]|uniref:Serine aminopeptidase S33 domain-containing protein n=1 Tax=Melghirimyces thermohalophilus TaxID=1236220 RepID=A0A1G6RHV7_9BACL|nr:alpha/beta hydrolase [Melghirimyces thermohalophilus]SDD03575.1 hypothetical protein SAMN04488112_12820 [Melghirimyces thermohalophilus]